MTVSKPISTPVLVPCVVCAAFGRTTMTPIETICRVADASRTMCPEHRRTHTELLDASIKEFVADCHRKSADARAA